MLEKFTQNMTQKGLPQFHTPPLSSTHQFHTKEPLLFSPEILPFNTKNSSVQHTPQFHTETPQFHTLILILNRRIFGVELRNFWCGTEGFWCGTEEFCCWTECF